MKGKMAIIGNGDSILAFKAAGLDAFAVDNAENGKTLLKSIAKDYQIIFVIDKLAVEMDDVLKKYVESAYPVIIPIPSESGSIGYGIKVLKREMERALGVDILFKN